MNRLLPTIAEWSIFVVLAVLCAAVAWRAQAVDVAAAGLAVPLFVVCALVGVRRNPRLGTMKDEGEEEG